MEKDKKAGSLILTLFAILFFLLSAVSCAPMLVGEAARNKTALEGGTMPKGRVYAMDTEFSPRELEGIIWVVFLQKGRVADKTTEPEILQRKNMIFFPKSKIQWIRLSALVLIAITFSVYVSRSILNLQFRILYHPSFSAPPVESLKANHIKLWQSSGADYRGLVTTDETRLSKGTIVVFHWNRGTAVDRVCYPDALGALGYRVILAEYPMYGGRKGELGEKAFVSDARETILLAFKDYGGPLFLLGESMGCGVAAAVAREAPVQIDGIILITPWDTLASLACSKFPFLLVRLILRDQYDSIGNLASFKGRIAVIGAGRDEVIPIRHAKDLYDSLSSTSKEMWIVQEAGHNDWIMHVDRNWWREIMDFMEIPR